MVTDEMKSQIRQLVQSPQWKSVEHVAEQLIAKIQDNSPLRETNDETLKELFMQEGKVRGIREVFQELMIIATQSNVEG